MRSKSTWVFPGYKALTYADVTDANRLNRNNDWGFSIKQLKRLGTMHRKAREAGDVRAMEKIEYRLTDCNFHSECSMLEQGDYEAYMTACDNI